MVRISKVNDCPVILANAFKKGSSMKVAMRKRVKKNLVCAQNSTEMMAE